MRQEKHNSNPYSMSQIYDDHSSFDGMSKVHIAAKIMDINIFSVLRIAYIHSFRQKPDNGVIEDHFNDFIFSNYTPKWAVSFCERIMKENNEGTYEPIKYGVKSRSLPLRHVREGSLLSVVPVILAIFLFWLSYRIVSFCRQGRSKKQGNQYFCYFKKDCVNA